MPQINVKDSGLGLNYKLSSAVQNEVQYFAWRCGVSFGAGILKKTQLPSRGGWLFLIPYSKLLYNFEHKVQGAGLTCLPENGTTALL